MRAKPFAVLAATLGACGGGGGSSNPADSVEALCQAQCDRNQRCASSTTPSSSCIAECKASGPAAEVLKPGVISSLTDCIAKLDCNQNDDQCTADVVAALDPGWQQDPAYNACLARAQDCDATGGPSFFDDKCVLYFVCKASVVAALDRCLAKPCEAIESCLNTVLQM